MKDLIKSKLDGLEEELKSKIQEAAETIEAIKTNKVDALVVNTETGEQVFTLHKTDNIYKTILDKVIDPSVIFAEDGTIFYSNRRFDRIVKAEREGSLVGSTIYKIISPVSIKKLELLTKKVDEKIAAEIEIINSDGTFIPVYMSLKSVTIKDTLPLLMMMINTTDTFKPEKPSVEKSEDDIINLTSEAIIVCDNIGKILRFNRSAVVLADQTFVNKDFDSVFNLSDKKGNNISIIKLFEGTELIPSELFFHRKDGKSFYLNISIELLKGINGSVQGYVITLTDITKHFLAEERALESLKQKTVLLKEIHHRVKNNLQIVSSIIKLQSYYIEDPKALALIGELNNRIVSISLIHELLYQSEGLAEVKMDIYVRRLVNFIVNTYEITPEKILIAYDIDPIFIVPEQVICLGLIIAELVTNSIKYAFADRKGVITISMKQEPEKVKLIVKDNGIGIPENVDIFNSETLGLKIVTSLTEQLGGSIDLYRTEGSEFKILF